MNKSVIKGIFAFAAVFMTACFITVQPEKAQAAQAVPISSAEDFLKMENDSSGNYYLTKDITVPANTTLFKDFYKQFNGTLDGKGHKIKGYTYSADVWTDYSGLFGYAKNATFKNLTMSDVNISLKKGGYACVLTAYPTKCKFQNITVSGKITVSGTTSHAAVIAVTAGGKCEFTKCINKTDITVNAYDVTNSADADYVDEQDGSACGIASSAYYSTAKNCSNSGKITINGDLHWASEGISAIGLFENIKSITGSKNTGTITAKNVSTGEDAGGGVLACGVAGNGSNVISCYNTGKVSASNNHKEVNMVAAGIMSETSKALKCYNTGSVQISGVAGETSGIKSGAGGIGGLGIYSITESYNTGTVAAKIKNGGIKAGGIAADICNVRNCYNTGKISTTATEFSFIGGIAGWQSAFVKAKDQAVVCNYNTGTVKAGKNITKGAILGYYEVLGIPDKVNIYNNYYKSGKAYGGANITWKPFFARSVKVSSITAKTCKKLSSKYWVYSSKHKRMILKNNKQK